MPTEPRSSTPGSAGAKTPTSRPARTSGCCSSLHRAQDPRSSWVRVSAPPNRARSRALHLVVSDLEATRAALLERGIEVSEIFHDAGGIFHHAGIVGRVGGPDPQQSSYGSFASFEDPDGNGWVFQEVTTRLPGRLDPATTTFSSVSDLSAALQRAAAAHGEHEKRTGQADPQWPDSYASYLVREQSGEALPS